jgi:hypothetical protein
MKSPAGVCWWFDRVIVFRVFQRTHDAVKVLKNQVFSDAALGRGLA